MMDFQQEIEKAKEYLTEFDTARNISVYDHLCGVLNKVLTERPKDPNSLIGSFLHEGADTQGDAPTGFKTLKNDECAESENVMDAKDQLLAERGLQLFMSETDDAGVEHEDEFFEVPLPNCMELAFWFERASVGLSRTEMFKIFLALKQLWMANRLLSIRFWGKVFGLQKDYIVAEVEYNEGEGDDDVETEKDEQEEEGENAVEEESEASESYLLPTEDDQLPRSAWRPPPVIPKEEHHAGANQKVYFVCNEPGGTWHRLPHVTPAQITVARQITKFFTGIINTVIESHPPFPGTEASLLRAQIARISAATQLSPQGYFVFENEEEEEEDEAYHESFTKNAEFEGLSAVELTKINNWVHHSHHILPQGRCTWYNPFKKSEDDEEEEELEEEEEEIGPQLTAEEGPKLLSPASDDASLSKVTPAWTTSLSSRVLPTYAVAIARSNRWPGAYCFGKGKQFDNIYIGWGQKYLTSCYNPPCPPPPLNEYFPIGGDIMEQDDPTLQEEEEVKQRREAAEKAAADDLEHMEEDDDDDE